MAEARGVDGRASLSAESPPFSARPLSSGAPLRRSPKVSDLSVGDINEAANGSEDNPPADINVQGSDQDKEFQEIPVSSADGSVPDIETSNRKSFAPPPQEFTGPDTPGAGEDNVPPSTLEGSRLSISSQRNLETNPLDLNSSQTDSKVITEIPSGGPISLTNPDGSNNPPPAGVVEPRGIIKSTVGETPGVTTVELGPGVSDAVAITLDVPGSATTTNTIVFPIDVVSKTVTATTGNTKRRPAKKVKSSAGGDFGERTHTASTGYSYSSYPASAAKSKKGKDFNQYKPNLQQQQEPQQQYRNENYNYQQQAPAPTYQDDQLPTVTKGMGAISFKVPGRITHKTTIKIAHYPQAGNEIISVEQPMPMPCGPNMDCMGSEDFPGEDEYGGCGGPNGGQYPSGNYTNNCNFATYNVTDGQQNQMDPNAMMQMQMMQQHQGYGNPYGGNGGYYPYGYPPY